MPSPKKEDKDIIIYLDTCIIQNVFRDRNKKDAELLKKIKERKYKCRTSIYALLELFETAKDREFFLDSVINKWTEVNSFLANRRQKKLKKKTLDEISESINNFFVENDYIDFYNLDEDDWKIVKEMCENTNLHFSDIMHLATAYNSECTHLITRDSFFIKEGNRTLEEGEVINELKIFSPDQFSREYM